MRRFVRAFVDGFWQGWHHARPRHLTITVHVETTEALRQLAHLDLRIAQVREHISALIH
jgi:hypothetical protein